MAPSPTLRRLRFRDLAHWAEDDHAAAFATFRRSAFALTRSDAVLRPGKPASEGLLRASEAAVRDAPRPSAARGFFESAFEPYEVVVPGGRGFLTGYFEPEVDASPARTVRFGAPLLARPDDLVTLGPGEAPAGFDPRLQGARRSASGLEPYPDRVEIEEGALGDRARPIAFLADAVEVFMIQVQGSARLRFPDGRTALAVYAGRNGRPYTSIGRILIETGRIPLEEMSLERLTAWLRQNPDEARAVMRRNASYVFFALSEDPDTDAGPIGGAGLALTPGRSLAVDRTLWSYGLPFWLEGELPRSDGRTEPLKRLMVAQDTGSAIVGAARGDYFVGTGPEAGTRAGLIRHPARFVVLLPKGDGPR